MVVTPAGDPCIIAVPYQGTLNFASFSAPEKVRENSFVLCARALGSATCRSALPLAVRLCRFQQGRKKATLPVKAVRNMF